MADVQIENGFWKISNALSEALVRVKIPGRHLQVMLTVMRFTYGFNKTKDRISVGQISAATSIDRRSVRRIMADLEAWQMLEIHGAKQGRAGELSVQKDYDKWAVRTPARIQHGGCGPPQHGGCAPGGCGPPTKGLEPPGTKGLEPPYQRQKTSSKDSVADEPASATQSPRVDGFIRMLKGKVPTGLNGETWDTPTAWFEHHRELIIAEAQLKAKCDDGPQFQRAFKSVMLRFWNAKAPPRGARLARNGEPVTSGGMFDGWDEEPKTETRRPG